MKMPKLMNVTPPQATKLPRGGVKIGGKKPKVSAMMPKIRGLGSPSGMQNC